MASQVLLTRGLGYLFVACVIVYCSSSAITSLLELGPLSLQGWLTLIISMLATVLALAGVVHRRNLLLYVLPLALFLAYFATRLLIDYSGLNIAQTLTVWLGFIAIVSLVSRYVVAYPQLVFSLERTVQFSSLILALSALSMSFFFERDPASPLVACVLVAIFSTNGESTNKRFNVVLIVLLVMISMFVGGRTATAASLSIVLIATIFNPGTGGRLKIPYWLRVLFTLILVALLLYLGVVFEARWISKFFDGDQAISVGHFNLNTSGRSYWWPRIWESALARPILGHAIPVPMPMQGMENWSQPHNDYLRLLHLGGFLGLFLWLVFVASYMKRYLSFYMSLSGSDCSIMRSWLLRGFLSLAALSMLMITDNVLVYSFVMFYVAVVCGIANGCCYLSRSKHGLQTSSG